MVAILLDSSLLVSVSLPRRHALIQDSSSNTAGISLLSTPAGVWAFADGRPFSGNYTAQESIMAYILTNPGVYLREISEDLGLSLGAVQYHVWALTRNGQLEECRRGRYRRFFGAARYAEDERTVLSLMRQGAEGRILAVLSEGQKSHTELAASVGLSSQALTWHMKRLLMMGVVESGPPPSGERCCYHLEESILAKVLAFGGGRPRPTVQVPGSVF